MSKPVIRVLFTFNLIGMMALPLTVFAHEGMTHDAPATAAAAADISATQGEVRKINQEQGTITLRHGDIKNLGMPGMTMVFVARDKAMLNGLAEGDQVVFRAERLNGVLMVIAIQKQGAASAPSNLAP